jgi:hypothetical protein
MTTIGIDIGGRMHAVARCRDGQPRADREILRVSQSRAGFAVLDAWLERQPERVSLVTMESSGHYWMPLASHLGRRDIPVAVVNPLAAKYFAKSRLARTKSDPADARSLAEMAMRDTPDARDPLAGVELRQAARFAMTLVTEQARVCQRLIRLVELGFPELGELFDDPTCRTAREVLRIAPTARAATRRRTPTQGRVIVGWGRRRPSGSRPPRPTRSPSPSSMPRSPSRSGSSSTSTTCSSARSRTPTAGSPGSSTARRPVGSRRSRASGPRSPRPSSQRSATSGASTTSTSSSRTPASTRPSAAPGARAPTPRRPGT